MRHFGARQLLSFYLMKQFLMSFAFVDVSSIFDSLADSLMHPARINQQIKDMWSKQKKFIQKYDTSAAHLPGDCDDPELQGS